MRMLVMMCGAHKGGIEIIRHDGQSGGRMHMCAGMWNGPIGNRQQCGRMTGLDTERECL